MKTFEIKDSSPADLYKAVKKYSKVVITHRGVPIAGLVSINDLNLLEGMQFEDLQELEERFELSDLTN